MPPSLFRSAMVGVGLAPRHKKRFEPFRHRFYLVLLNGSGRVDILRTCLGAFTDEGAAPDSLVLREDVETLISSLVSRILVIALCESHGRRSDEMLIQPVDRTGGITDHTVDAHAELLVALQLLWRLQVFSLG